MDTVHIVDSVPSISIIILEQKTNKYGKYSHNAVFGNINTQCCLGRDIVSRTMVQITNNMLTFGQQKTHHVNTNKS